MEKQKKSVGTIALVILLLIVTVVSLILATYAWAKYTTTQSSNATAPVAKWNVSFTPDNSTFVGHYSHVVDGKIAPGTTGTFDITVVPSTTEVCFNYTIKIDSVQFLNGETVLPDSTVLKERTAEEGGNITLGMFRSHIVFKDSANNDITDGTNVISGTYDLGGTHNSTTGAALTGTNTVTWTWAYEQGTGAAATTYDEIDTAAGEYAAKTGNDFKMKVNYTATAVQVEPNAANH